MNARKNILGFPFFPFYWEIRKRISNWALLKTCSFARPHVISGKKGPDKLGFKNYETGKEEKTHQIWIKISLLKSIRNLFSDFAFYCTIRNPISNWALLKTCSFARPHVISGKKGPDKLGFKNYETGKEEKTHQIWIKISLLKSIRNLFSDFAFYCTIRNPFFKLIQTC